MKKWIAWVLAAGLAAAAGEAAMTAKEQPKTAVTTDIGVEQQRDVAEAVFRYLFDHNASAAQKNAKAYCLEVLGQDPDDALLERFKAQKPPVDKASAFKEGAGLKFRIQRMTRVTATRVDVQAGYYEGNMSSSGGSYIVELKNGKWGVRPAGPIAVS